MLKAITIIFAATALFCCGRAGRDPRADEARLRILDSITAVDAADSVERESLNKMLSYRLEALQLQPLDSVGPDVLRMTVEFSWGGPQEVGPWVSMLVWRDDNAGYKISAIGFPGRKRTEMVNRDLDEDEFFKLSNFFDSINFQNVSRFEHVGYASTDPDRYFIERRRNGRYHAISRSSFVDVFVLRLFGDVATAAGMPAVLIERFRDDELRAAEKLKR